MTKNIHIPATPREGNFALDTRPLEFSFQGVGTCQTLPPSHPLEFL